MRWLPEVEFRARRSLAHPVLAWLPLKGKALLVCAPVPYLGDCRRLRLSFQFWRLTADSRLPIGYLPALVTGGGQLLAAPLTPVSRHALFSNLLNTTTRSRDLIFLKRPFGW